MLPKCFVNVFIMTLASDATIVARSSVLEPLHRCVMFPVWTAGNVTYVVFVLVSW